MAQKFYEETPDAIKWVNKKFKKLNKNEKIAQLMIIRAHSNLGEDHVAKVTETIRKYNVGGLCFFQGGPVRQAVLTNKYQAIAKTLAKHYEKMSTSALHSQNANFDEAHYRTIEDETKHFRSTLSHTETGPDDLSNPITDAEVAAQCHKLHNNKAPSPLDAINNARTSFWNMEARACTQPWLPSSACSLNSKQKQKHAE